MSLVSDIQLVRKDTTPDLSRKAEIRWHASLLTSVLLPECGSALTNLYGIASPGSVNVSFSL